MKLLSAEQQTNLLAGKPGHLPLPMEFTAISVWFERDRAHVELRINDPFNRDAVYEHTLVEWWDEELEEMIADGFLNPKGVILGNYRSADWHMEVYRYYMEEQLIPKEMPPVDFFAIKLSYEQQPWFVWDELPYPERSAKNDPLPEIGIGDVVTDDLWRGWVVGNGIIGNRTSVWKVNDRSGTTRLLPKNITRLMWTKEDIEYANWLR